MFPYFYFVTASISIFMPSSSLILLAIRKVTDLLEFFEVKESQWPNTGVENTNGFPWVQFSRPNSAFGEVINVSVAQHNKLPFSDAALSAELADLMWGRGYTSANGADHSNDAINSGLNFEEQWDNAIAADGSALGKLTEKTASGRLKLTYGKD